MNYKWEEDNNTTVFKITASKSGIKQIFDHKIDEYKLL